MLLYCSFFTVLLCTHQQILLIIQLCHKTKIQSSFQSTAGLFIVQAFAPQMKDLLKVNLASFMSGALCELPKDSRHACMWPSSPRLLAADHRISLFQFVTGALKYFAIPSPCRFMDQSLPSETCFSKSKLIFFLKRPRKSVFLEHLHWTFVFSFLRTLPLSKTVVTIHLVVNSQNN